MPVFESATASVDLSWSPYAGARFPLYLVRRRTQSLSAITITQIVDVADTTYTDQNLLGNEQIGIRCGGANRT
jgi:hypothetical protein